MAKIDDTFSLLMKPFLKVKVKTKLMWQLYTLNNKDIVDQKAFVPFTYFLSTYFYNLVMNHTHQEYELQIKSIY